MAWWEFWKPSRVVEFTPAPVPPDEGAGKYRVTLSDGRFIDVNATSTQAAFTQARHEETSRIYYAAARGKTPEFLAASPVSLVKLGD